MQQQKSHLIRLTLCLLLVLAISWTSRAQDFEGVIYYEIPELVKQGVEEMPYMIKDSKVRMELGDGSQQGAMLILPDEKQMVIIIEEMQGFMALDFNEAADPQQAAEYENSQASKTGDSKTIAGTDCEVWAITSEDGNYETCMAEGFGSFMMPGHPMSERNAPEWAREIMKDGLLPLEVVELRENGKKVLQMIATQVEPKPMDAALFEIPQHYRDMSGMMKQMMKPNH